MLKVYIEKLLAKQPLTREETRTAILTLLKQDVPAVQIAALLVLLKTHGETVEEILGVIDALQATMQPLVVAAPTLDIVGTGGDQSGSVNISTGAAILAASAGVRVVKVGNRSVSSRCGSADVLESLGIDIEMPVEKIQASVAKLNIGYCFAQKFHPAVSQLRTLRRELGVPTIFNLVGPFSNPARVQHGLVGVAAVRLMPMFAEIMKKMTPYKSAIVHSLGMDEITCCGETQVVEVENGKSRTYTMHPKDFNMPVYSLETLRGGDAKRNAGLLQDALANRNPPLRDALILNAGMAIYLFGIAQTPVLGAETARHHLENGDALRLLEQWQNI